MKSRIILSLSLFFIGLFLLICPFNITGAFIGVPYPSNLLDIIGSLLILSSFIVFNLDDLESGVKNWKKYEINKDSMLMDIEQDIILI